MEKQHKKTICLQNNLKHFISYIIHSNKVFLKIKHYLVFLNFTLKKNVNKSTMKQQRLYF